MVATRGWLDVSEINAIDFAKKLKAIGVKTIEHALQVLIQFKHKLLLLLFVIKILLEILHFLH